MRKICLGVMCLLLEDLGFVQGPPSIANHQTMTYYCYSSHHYQRVYAGVNDIILLELFIKGVDLSLDKWELDPRGLYLTIDDADFDLRNPRSIPNVSRYIQAAISDTQK